MKYANKIDFIKYFQMDAQHLKNGHFFVTMYFFYCVLCYSVLYYPYNTQVEMDTCCVNLRRNIQKPNIEVTQATSQPNV